MNTTSKASADLPTTVTTTSARSRRCRFWALDGHKALGFGLFNIPGALRALECINGEHPAAAVIDAIGDDGGGAAVPGADLYYANAIAHLGQQDRLQDSSIVDRKVFLDVPLLRTENSGLPGRSYWDSQAGVVHVQKTFADRTTSPQIWHLQHGHKPNTI